MTRIISRRNLLRIGGGTGRRRRRLGDGGRAQPGERFGAARPRECVQGRKKTSSQQRLVCELWRQPEPALLIHGNDESSIVWAWGGSPRMAQEFRCSGSISLALAGPGFPRGSNGRCPASRRLWRTCSTWRCRVGAHRRRQDGRRDRDAVCGRLSETDPHARRRQRTCVRHRHDQRLAHSPAEPAWFGGFERDDRILEHSVCHGES